MQNNNIKKTFEPCWNEFKTQWIKYFGQVQQGTKVIYFLLTKIKLIVKG